MKKCRLQGNLKQSTTSSREDIFFGIIVCVKQVVRFMNDSKLIRTS